MTEFFAHYFNEIGMVGVVLVLFAYFMLQVGRMSGASVRFSFLNLMGSLLILVSLCYTWNLASGVIEIAWLLISFYGLVKSTRIYYSSKEKHGAS